MSQFLPGLLLPSRPIWFCPGCLGDNTLTGEVCRSSRMLTHLPLSLATSRNPYPRHAPCRTTSLQRTARLQKEAEGAGHAGQHGHQLRCSKDGKVAEGALGHVGHHSTWRNEHRQRRKSGEPQRSCSPDQASGGGRGEKAESGRGSGARVLHAAQMRSRKSTWGSRANRRIYNDADIQIFCLRLRKIECPAVVWPRLKRCLPDIVQSL